MCVIVFGSIQQEEPAILLRIEKSTIVINFTSGKGNEVLSRQTYKLAMKESDQEFEHLFAN